MGYQSRAERRRWALADPLCSHCYPEEWPRERWEYDARLMAEASFNVARLAELAWGAEFGVMGHARCCCHRCQQGLRQWLERRYGTIEALGRAWGAPFWGHHV